MSISNSRLAYTDCEALFDKALDDPKGCRVLVGEEGKARHFVMRMHKCRQLMREDNARMYEIGHPLHGTSIWDPLKCSIREDTEGNWYVYVEKVDLNLDLVESLSEIEEVDYEEPKRIEHVPAGLIESIATIRRKL